MKIKNILKPPTSETPISSRTTLTPPPLSLEKTPSNARSPCDCQSRIFPVLNVAASGTVNGREGSHHRTHRPSWGSVPRLHPWRSWSWTWFTWKSTQWKLGDSGWLWKPIIFRVPMLNFWGVYMLIFSVVQFYEVMTWWHVDTLRTLENDDLSWCFRRNTFLNIYHMIFKYTLRYSGGTVVDHFRPFMVGLKSISPSWSVEILFWFQTFWQDIFQRSGIISWIHVSWIRMSTNCSRDMQKHLKTHINSDKQKAPETYAANSDDIGLRILNIQNPLMKSRLLTIPWVWNHFAWNFKDWNNLCPWGWPF